MLELVSDIRLILNRPLHSQLSVNFIAIDLEFLGVNKFSNST